MSNLTSLFEVAQTALNFFLSYTTLFRSEVDDRRNAGEILHQNARGAVLDLAVDPPFLQPVGHRLEVVAGDRLTIFKPQDRKSTRLNSSHPSISYAVFCLKKKNDNKTSAS